MHERVGPVPVPSIQRIIARGCISRVQVSYICSLIKKPDLDPAEVKNYRPISNLTVLSKMLEKLVARQLIDYLSDNNLLPDCKSAYRAFQSTETAIAGLLSDILLALDAGNIAALASSSVRSIDVKKTFQKKK